MLTCSPLIAAVLVLLPLFTACRAEENPDDRKLLDTLRSDDFDAREAAKKKLIDRGEAIRPLITAEQAKKDLDPDYKEYLKTIGGKLKDADVLKAFDRPKTIDLEVKDEGVNAILDKLKNHFGFAAVAKGDAGAKKISVNIKGATYLEAVDAVRKAANLSYDRAEIMQMMFKQRGKNAAEAVPALSLRENGQDPEVPAVAKGPALAFFESVNYHLSRTVIFGNEGNKNGNSTKSLGIQGFLILEPDLRCSAVGVSNLRALTATNETLGTGNVSLNNYWGGTESKTGFRIYSFNANFSFQNDPPAKLNWKMSAKLQVPIKLNEKRLENLADLVGKPEDFFGGTFTLQKLERDSRMVWKMSYNTTGALMDTTNSGRMVRWNNGGEALASGNPEFASGMSILDAQNNPVETTSSSMNGGGNSYHVDLEMTTEPRSIVFRKPGDAQTREFELELPNVPVP